MAEERAQRRLAAILAADVVGYSRLMGEDESGTLNALNLHRAELIHPTVAGYRGRIVKLMGDGALVEFPSDVDAVECAVAVQRGMEERNADIPDGKRITFRIGINLGDIIIEGDDIYGDGVNVAARLEAEAESGGICISGDAYRQVLGKIDLAFEDLGERTLKNIAEPIRAYGWHGGTAAAQTENATVPTPQHSDKPSIAVLPFDNMSNDPEQEYFSDGLVEDLTTDISKISGLFVIARNSSFAFKGQAIDIKEIAQKLGVKHVVEGSVRKMGSRLRINAQLIDAATGGHIWAERYDGDVENIFEFQDDIRDQIVSALQVNLTPTDKALAVRKPTDSAEAYDLFLKGRASYYRYTPDNMLEAKNYFEKAIEVDPNYAVAYSYLSYALLSGWAFLFPGFDDVFDRAKELAEKGVALDGMSPLTNMRLGWLQVWTGLHDQAEVNFEKAVELAPDNAEILATYAQVLNWCGQPERSLQMMDKVFSIDTFAPPSWEFHVGSSYFLMGQYDKALNRLKLAVERAPSFIPAYEILTCLYVELGQLEEARDAVKTILDISPKFTISHAAAVMCHKSEEHRHRFVDGFREAGLPE